MEELRYGKKYTRIRDMQGRSNYNMPFITDLNNEEQENIISKAYKKRAGYVKTVLELSHLTNTGNILRDKMLYKLYWDKLFV